MTTPGQLEVADVVRHYGATYLERYAHVTSIAQRRVLQAVSQCRTAALGGHHAQCDDCGYEVIQYNSCRHRNCPKCQGQAQAAWLEGQRRDLLDVPYNHVVFTLPSQLSPLALQNPRVLYNLLFQAVSETLQTIARDPKHLGADIGFLAVLHTWGQTLHHHPHLHCLVPAGGVAPDGLSWQSCRKGFFLPVRVLSRFFRRTFLKALDRAATRGELGFHGRCQSLQAPVAWRKWLRTLKRMEWVVYAKRPLAGPQTVLTYLARYTHRSAISNRRLLALENGQVKFRWKDYHRGNRNRTITLDAVEFIRRFLLHTLPLGFQRVRHYGFLANGVRKVKLPLCRELLGQSLESSRDNRETADSAEVETSSRRLSTLCPACQVGQMQVRETWFPKRDALEPSNPIPLLDTS